MNGSAMRAPESGEDTEYMAEELSRRLASRVRPSAGFAQSLGHEIRHAARQQIGSSQTQFTNMVVELRRLVRLLRQTLVPVPPSVGFVRTLGSHLRVQAADLIQARERRWRWLVLGGVVGSVMSVVGVVTTVFLRRRLTGAPAPVGDAQRAVPAQDNSAKAA
jgi:hypothetical protein